MAPKKKDEPAPVAAPKPPPEPERPKTPVFNPSSITVKKIQTKQTHTLAQYLSLKRLISRMCYNCGHTSPFVCIEMHENVSLLTDAAVKCRNARLEHHKDVSH